METCNQKVVEYINIVIKYLISCRRVGIYE